MKRCWIYCGVPQHSTLAELEKRRNALQEYAVQKEYEIVEFTSETINETFVRSSGALVVLRAITEHRMDVLVIEKGILDKKDLTIRTFFEFAQENGVSIQEIDLKGIGEK